jgi:hypothetical protein
MQCSGMASQWHRQYSCKREEQFRLRYHGNGKQYSYQRKTSPCYHGDTVVCRNTDGHIYATTLNAGSTYAWTISGGTILTDADVQCSGSGMASQWHRQYFSKREEQFRLRYNSKCKQYPDQRKTSPCYQWRYGSM